jgi:hypothetical protein
MVVAEAEDRQKWAQEARAGKLDEVHMEVVRINAAQLLRPWGQQLAATMCHQLPMVVQGSPYNIFRLLMTLISMEEAEREKELLPNIWELIKGCFA